MIDGRNPFDQPNKNDTKTYVNIRKIITVQGDDWTIGCLLDYTYFKKHKMLAIDLSELQALDADLKATQHINFTRNLSDNNNRLFFIIEEAKEKIFDFSQGTVKVLRMLQYDLARIAKVSGRKVFVRTACSTILFCSNIISI